MLRERVLEEWNSFKKKILTDTDLLERLSFNLNDMTFDGSSDGYGIKKPSYQVMETLKRNLPSIVQSYRELRNDFVNRQFGDKQLIMSTWIIYTSYIGLVETYKKIIEHYDESQSGPTIEDV